MGLLDCIKYILVLFSDTIPGNNGVLSLVEIDIGNEVQSDRSLQQHSGLKGYMQKFTFNGRNYFEMGDTEQIEKVEITAW